MKRSRHDDRRSMFEGLERRRLLAASVPSQSGQIQEQESSYAVVHDQQGGSQWLTRPGREGHYHLPTLKSDGSVTLVGSENDDQITVERVDRLDGQPGEFAKDQYDVYAYVEPDGRTNYITGVFTTEWMNEMLVRQEDILAAVTQDLQSALEQHAPQSTIEKKLYDEMIQEYKDRVEVAEGSVERTKHVLELIEGGDLVRYSVAGIYDFYVDASTATSSAKLNVDAGAGSDTVRIGSNVPLRANINGGSGADVLTSGKKQANLFGGGGSDRLVSRSTHGGALEGGKGSDKYYSRAGISSVRFITRNDGDKLQVNGRLLTVSTAAGALNIVPVAGKPGVYYLSFGKDGNAEIRATA